MRFVQGDGARLDVEQMNLGITSSNVTLIVDEQMRVEETLIVVRLNDSVRLEFHLLSPSLRPSHGNLPRKATDDVLEPIVDSD